MGFFDQLNKTKGGYIFLSHSHDDIVKVREIRNSLEQDGFEPLCFYLKCLSDESEIEDLIKREIDAREWFLFLDSDNARKSKWVTMEREYITSRDNKKIITIDLDDAQSVANAIQKISHNLRIFMSFSFHDLKIAERIMEKLRDKDYLVFSPQDIHSGTASYPHSVMNAITEASQEGCVIVLISQNSMNSPHVLNELEFALSQNGRILPIVIGNVLLTGEMKYHLRRHHLYTLSEEPMNYEIRNLVEDIGNAIARSR